MNPDWTKGWLTKPTLDLKLKESKKECLVLFLGIRNDSDKICRKCSEITRKSLFAEDKTVLSKNSM